MSHKTKYNSRRGLTLIEILITVAILGVTLAIALPIYSNARKSANLTACKANIVAIQQAEEAYRVRNRTYTATLSNLTNLVGAAPTCPTDGSAYVVFISGSGASQTLHIKCNASGSGKHTANPHLLTPTSTVVNGTNVSTVTGAAADPCTSPNVDPNNADFEVTGTP